MTETELHALLLDLVFAWDHYRLGEVSKLIAKLRAYLGLSLPERNKDR